MKKIILSLGAVTAVLVGASMFAAFEAHVVNVTAKIENALSVNATELDFGTVFPQENLAQPVSVALSGSFMTENRVDDVSYMIRQKPKCGWTLNNGELLLGLPTYTGEVYAGTADPLPPYSVQHDGYYVVCPDPGTPVRPAGSVYAELPSLCQYISKHKEDDGQFGSPTAPGPEVQVNSFHQPFVIDPNGGIDWTEAKGYLSKSFLLGDNQTYDTQDNWLIDLAVPCFGGYCAQDWEDFVDLISGDPTTNGTDYTQPIANEHKVFGCDLWFEVTGVSQS